MKVLNKLGYLLIRGHYPWSVRVSAYGFTAHGNRSDGTGAHRSVLTSPLCIIVIAVVPSVMYHSRSVAGVHDRLVDRYCTRYYR